MKLLVAIMALSLTVSCKQKQQAQSPVKPTPTPVVVVSPTPVPVKGVWCKANLADFSPCNPGPAQMIGQACDKIGEKAPGCSGGAECKESCE